MAMIGDENAKVFVQASNTKPRQKQKKATTRQGLACDVGGWDVQCYIFIVQN
jgi:hypothetical protein